MIIILHQVTAIGKKWETKLAEPEFFTVSCSRLQSFIEVGEFFLHFFFDLDLIIDHSVNL